MGAGNQLHPGKHPGRFRFPRRRAYQAAPVLIPTVAGIGAAGSATFMLSLQPGTKVTLGWGTDIIPTYSGNQQRINTTGPAPRQRFEGVAFLLDGQDRDIKGTLQRVAAAGSTFLLALPYEALTLSADAVGTIVSVASTASCDWVLPGQRCLLLGIDGTTQAAVVQSTTATTVTLGAVDGSGNLITVGTLGTPGKAGAQLMPVIQVLLEGQQGFSRYAVSAGLWSIRGMAVAFGWAATDSMGVGASIVTYTYGVPVAVSTLIEVDLLIWDRPNLIDGTASESMLSSADLVDLGGLPYGIGGSTVPDWARPIRYSSSSAAEWQWVKAFLRQVLGRQKAFGLPTNRPDLVYVAASGATLIVQSSAATGGGDYASWYTSLAHRRLAITKTDGSVQYVAVTATPTNNNDGTLTLTLDQAISGTAALVSFLELVRFDNGDSDDFAVTWDGPTFTVDLLARTTEETVTPPTLLMYDTSIDAVFTYGGSAPSDQELIIAAGQVTYVRITSNRAVTFGGIQVSSPGGAQDGMVVTLVDEGMPSSAVALIHEDTTWTAGDRLWMPGKSTAISSNLSYTFVYSAAASRWVCIWGDQT